MEEVNTGKESKEAGESVRGWYNSFNSKNREHWEAEWDVRGTLVAELTDWKGSNQKKKSQKFSWDWGRREVAFSSSWFPWEAIYLILSHFCWLCSGEVEFLIFSVSLQSMIWQPRSSTHPPLETCPSAVSVAPAGALILLGKDSITTGWDGSGWLWVQGF